MARRKRRGLGSSDSTHIAKAKAEMQAAERNFERSQQAEHCEDKLYYLEQGFQRLGMFKAHQESIGSDASAAGGMTKVDKLWKEAGSKFEQKCLRK